MSFFSSVSEIVAHGINYGANAASQGLSKLSQLGVDAVGAVSAYAAGKGADYATKNHERRHKLLKQLDKRDRFTNKNCQTCAESHTRHPNPNDGKYMGAGCQLTSERPDKGVEPPGCEGKVQFPKVTFTNGINNTEDEVCETIKALAKSQCVEVVAVYNATYQDPALQAPDRRMSDYKQAALDGLEGSVKGSAKGAMKGAAVGPAGVLVGALKGAATGFAKGAAPGVALQEASRVGLVQDIVDCVDNINGSGDEAAARALANDIVASLEKDPPQKMVLYAHSQGGLINKEAIAQAERVLTTSTIEKAMDRGMPEEEAIAIAKSDTQKRLGNLEVNTFGTLERGLPPGPVYNRYTNTRDPVPKVIKAAQQNYGVPYMDADPPRSPDVKVFTASPSINPMDAHGMREAYIPYLNQQNPGRRCC